MLKKTKEFIIPINPGKEELDKFNKEMGTEFKPTEEHITSTLESVISMIVDCAEKGGSYVSDAVKVTVTVEYVPEDK
jgi:hypothetical protein